MNIIQIGLCLLIFGFPLLSASQSSALTQCNKGPSNWCKNFVTAKQCNAVRHCIQTVWEKQYIIEDNDSICQICLNMVKQARDQLESNETQSDLKAVFEGSCNLIPLKPVKKECNKLADDFVPELIEALSSQMNPQVVCSVAGLCNNAKIDEILKEYKRTTLALETTEVQKRPEHSQLSCDECKSVANLISTKFKITDPDEMLESVLTLCGQMSSFSDACANIALSYFDASYKYLTEYVTPDRICHLSGTCAYKYHYHPENIEVRSRSNIGVVSIQDDIPCELCQQLVHHLQEVLISNTTEIEFRMVVEGLCKQTKSFKNECLNLADQYCDKVYYSLVHNLDANGACFLIGVCPKGSGTFLGQRDIIPLIPYVEAANIKTRITKSDTKPSLIFSKKPTYSINLPTDLLMFPPGALSLVDNGQLCTLCEYFLHFLQETLATPATEEEIKEALTQACKKLPTGRGNCQNFVDMYGDAVVALIIQGLDPRAVCPELRMCPKLAVEKNISNLKPVDVHLNSNVGKPTCPLCLFAVKQAQDLIKDNKSKKNIKSVLDNLCSHLPKKLKDECVDFVETYSNELVDMLITDFNPQEICVFIKLCLPEKSEEGAYIDGNTNDEIGSPFSPECLLCKTVIAEAEKKIGPEKTKEKIEYALYHSCDKIGKLVDSCHKFIDKYGDKIANFLLQEMTPDQVCKEIGYCAWSKEVLYSDTSNAKNNENNVTDPPPCVLCEFIISKIEANLNNKATQDEIKREVENVCKAMPSTISQLCDQFVQKYGDILITLLQTLPPKMVCQKIELCAEKKINDQIIECGVCHGATSSLLQFIEEKHKSLGTLEMIEVACENLSAKYYNKCSELLRFYGKSILNMINSTNKQTTICATIGKCFKGESSELAFLKIEDDTNIIGSVSPLIGSEECTFGPAYWCANEGNAKYCKATEYCLKEVWQNRFGKD